MASTSKIEWVELGDAASALNQCRKLLKAKINEGLFTVSADKGKRYLKIAEINRHFEKNIIIKKTA